jgi:hypothetical protein
MVQSYDTPLVMTACTLQAKTDIGSGGSTRSFVSHVMVADLPLGNVAYAASGQRLLPCRSTTRQSSRRAGRSFKTPILAACTLYSLYSIVDDASRDLDVLAETMINVASRLDLEPWYESPKPLDSRGAFSSDPRRCFDRPAVLRRRPPAPSVERGHVHVTRSLAERERGHLLA